MFIEQLELGKDKVFCYILACCETGDAVVIDPCGDPEQVLGVLRQHRFSLLYILNTHCHPDHTCSNKPLKDASGAAIVRHAADELLLQDPHATQYFARQGYAPSPPADILVQDNDRLTFGGQSLKIIHTPGHSPGSICLLAGGNLFTGDSLFVGAAGRVDVPGGDFTTLLASLENKIGVLPDDTIVWPGHDYGDTRTSTIGREKKENPYLGGTWQE